MQKPKVISLFGGLIAEFGVREWFDTILMIDNDPLVCQTYTANHNKPVRCEDLSNLSLPAVAKKEVGEIDGIIASPPCQDFSKANSQKKGRNARYLDTVEWVRVFKPKFVIIENVATVMSESTGLPWFNAMRFALQSLGYQTITWVLNAANYGTAQHRERCFLIAMKAGRSLPLRPIATHGDPDSFEVKDGSRLPWKSLCDVIGSLTEDSALSMGCASLSPKRRRLLQMVPPGGNWRNIPRRYWKEFIKSCSLTEKGQPHEYVARRAAFDKPSELLLTGPSALTKSKAIHPGVKCVPNFSTNLYRRYAPHKPCYTLTTNPQPIKMAFSHPGCWVQDECYQVGDKWFFRDKPLLTRNLSVLEYLLIQGVPDAEKFVWPFGTIKLPKAKDRYRLIGNGIPPALISVVCGAVNKALYALETVSKATTGKVQRIRQI